MMITTIIPAYRCAEYIRTAVCSVLSQDVGSRILVIDDASDDDIRGQIADLIDDGKVEYYRNDVNSGVAYTRNRGIELADTEYIAFLDGDDFWKEGKLSEELKLIESKSAPLVFSARELYTPEGDATGRLIEAPSEIDFDGLLHSNRIPLGSVLMKTEIAREFKFVRHDLHEDYILWLNVVKKYGKVYGINKPYLACRQAKGGKSRNKLKSAMMHYKTLRYVGVSRIRSFFLMFSYAFAGVKKYMG